MSDYEVSVHSALSGPKERTAAAAGELCITCADQLFLSLLQLGNNQTWVIAEVLADLREAGIIPGWRNEMYPVTDRWHDEPFMLMERAASVLFGIKASPSHGCRFGQ